VIGDVLSNSSSRNTLRTADIGNHLTFVIIIFSYIVEAIVLKPIFTLRVHIM